MTKAERTRKFIIEKSASLINKKGMAGTSLSDIMEATKLAKGGIYGNFESKDEICLESFSFLANVLSDELNSAIAAGKNTKDKFFNLLDAYNNRKAFEGGCPILNFGVEADDTHEKMKGNVKKVILEAQARILTILNEGIKKTELSPAINPQAFSIKTFAMIEGGILCKKVLGSDAQMKIIIAELKKELEVYLI